MTITGRPITNLPAAESVTNADYIPVYQDGVAKRAPASMFRGDPATINGVNALTVEAGENVTMSQEGDTLRVSATDTTYDPATTSAAGLMSAADKSKLDGVESGAEVNVLEGLTLNGNAVSVTNKTAALTLNKSAVGLGNVDNTSDANKPVSTATQTELNKKVDKISGKGLSTNDYTTAEKDKLLGIEAGAQVNEVTSEHYRSMMAMLNVVRIQDAGFRKQFENFRAVFDNFLYAQGVPCYMTAVGTGVVDIRDAAAGQIHSITVDSSLSGQTLYVQLSNASGLTDTTVTVNSSGVATVSLATRKGRNRLYITTSAYTFPPGTNGGHGGHTSGTYVNSHKDENGQFAYDYWIPNHGVEATVRYSQDTELGDEIAKEIDYDEFLAMLGLSVTYSVTSNPAAVQNAGKELYMKMEGYPFGTLAKPIYAKTSYPNELCSVYYVAEYHQLML